MAHHIEITVNEELFAQLLVALELTEKPPSLSLNHPGFATGTNAGPGTVECRGLYDPRTHTVYLSIGNASLQRERLIETTQHMLLSFLHEMRHAHQHVHWKAEELAAGPGGYHNSHVEVDANAWAEGAAPSFRGLVRINRRPVGGRTGFGRMSQRAERSLP